MPSDCLSEPCGWAPDVNREYSKLFTVGAGMGRKPEYRAAVGDGRDAAAGAGTAVGANSTADARALASDMRTTPGLILSRRRLQFACHIRNVTPNAVSIPVPVGELERQERLTEEAYERLRELNRNRVSISQPPRSDSFTLTPNERPALRVLHTPNSPGDPSAASEDW